MIQVNFTHGLGNNLFQYATGRHLAIKNNTDLRLNILNNLTKRDILGLKCVKMWRTFSIEPFNYTTRVHEKFARKLGLPISNNRKNLFVEESWGFDPSILELKDGIELEGYFQSEKYFKDCEQVIRKDLAFNPQYLSQKAKHFKEHIENTNAVSLHVRRGDYLGSQLHDVVNAEYYQLAVDYILKQIGKPQFFVFSDGMDWCQENLELPNCTFVSLAESSANPAVDLQLMSLCKHQIIPNSTFSWWAAWLNANPEKIVIAPYRWFNDGEKNQLALRDTIPDGWVRLEF